MATLNNNISVIIPVFNAGKFLKKAVESALDLPEVMEVLLVEDGSADDSLEICEELEIKNDKIRLFTHANNANKGAGASRNIGIENAKGDFIAFLDADDYYLTNRFEAENTIFETQPEVDGVYGALGFHYYSEQGKKKYEQASFGKLTTVNGKPSPNELFLSLNWLHPKTNGNFSIVALTLKRKIFDQKAEKFGDLKMHEDTLFIMQLSLTCKLVAGIIDRPIALRGVHDNNRIVNNKNQLSRLVMWKDLYQWAKASGKSKPVILQLQAFMLAEQIKFSRGLTRLAIWSKASVLNKYFLTDSYLFTLCTQTVFGKIFSKVLCFVKDKIQVRVIKKEHNYYINV